MKYLLDALTGEFSIDKMTILAMELGHERDSDIIQDLAQNDAAKLCEMFEWKDGDEIIEEINTAIEDNALTYFLTERAKIYGIIAQVHIPVIHNIRFGKEQKILSWQASFGHCHIDWVWADSIGEFTHKMNIICKKWEKYDTEKQLKELKTKAVETTKA